MAERWIKMKTRPCDPRVQSLVRLTKAPLGVVYVKIAEWFFYVDEFLTNEVTGLTVDQFNEVIGWKPAGGESLGVAMQREEVGWLTKRDDGILLVPEFDKHFSQSAKIRARDAARKALDRSPDSVRANTDDVSNSLSDAFKAFWKVCSRRVARADAERAFAWAARQEHPAVIQDAWEEFCVSPKGKSGKHCPYPATWLRDKRWQDERLEWWAEGDDPENASKSRGAYLDHVAAVTWWDSLPDPERQAWIDANAAWFPAKYEHDGVSRKVWEKVHAERDWGRVRGWAYKQMRLKGAP